MAKNIARVRGIFLTIMIIYGVLEAVLVFFSGIIYPIQIGLRGENLNQILMISVLEIIPLIIALYGIWKWKKWGAYSLFVYILISIICTVVFDILLAASGYAPGVIVYDVLGGAVWYWALYRKWSYFD